jgi:cephalosporin hydroxylase
MRRRLPTRAGFAVWRDTTRLRLEQRFQRPLRKSFLRLYHDRHLHPANFVTGTEGDGARAAWLGVPTWKLPSDMWVYQEILAETRPELIVETGTQYGGSALFYASVFDLLGAGEVVTIDIDTSAVHPAVREHPRVTVTEGSSTDPEVVDAVRTRANGKRTMLILDSDHKQAHVAGELRMWSDVVSPGCYLVVEDTALGTEYLPGWGGSLAALEEWLPGHPEFRRDESREKFLATVNPGGYLVRR